MTLDEKLCKKLININSDKKFVTCVMAQVCDNDENKQKMLDYLEHEHDEQQIMMHGVSIHRNLL